MIQKNVAIVIVFLLCIIALTLFGQNKNEVQEREQTSDITIESSSYTREVYFEENSSVADRFPEEMICYLENALKEENLIENLENISAEYVRMDNEKIDNILCDTKSKVLQDFQMAEGKKSDIWYHINFSDSEEAVIIEHEENGYRKIYIFCKYYNVYEPAFRTGEQNANNAYFISWDYHNYIAVSHMEENRITGCGIYDFADDVLLGTVADLELESTLEIKRIYYNYIESGTGGNKNDNFLVYIT